MELQVSPRQMVNAYHGASALVKLPGVPFLLRFRLATLAQSLTPALQAVSAEEETLAEAFALRDEHGAIVPGEHPGTYKVDPKLREAFRHAQQAFNERMDKPELFGAPTLELEQHLRKAEIPNEEALGEALLLLGPFLAL